MEKKRGQSKTCQRWQCSIRSQEFADVKAINSPYIRSDPSKENGTYDDDRKRNIVIYNLPEGYTGTDEEYNVRYLFEKYLNLKDEDNICDYNILHITRLGKAEEGKTRPLKVKLANEWEKRLVINRAKILQWTADNDISKRI